jgi:hypothetical protein
VKFCGTLDHCFITTHSIHNWGDLQIHFSVLFPETRHHTHSHLISGTKHFLSPQHLIPSGCQQPEFHWWLPPPVWFFFFGHHSDTYSGQPYLDFSVWPHSCRNVTPLRCECLLQWQQNRSKAMRWLLYKIPAIQGCPSHYWQIDSCVLHVATLKPIQITPALQEAHLWALL